MQKRTKATEKEDDYFILNLFITFAVMYFGLIVLAS
jgi:hypothetical protein